MPPEDETTTDAPETSEIDDGDLTSDQESGNISDILVEALEADEEAPDESQDGPAEDAGELSTDETAAPDESDPRDLEIQRLKELVTSSQDSITKLTEILTKKGLQDVEPKVEPAPRVSEEALHLALYGQSGDEGAWKALPAHERQEATRLAREHFAREAKFARDPRARYEDLKKPVMDDVLKLIEPLVSDYFQRQAEAAQREFAGDVTDPADRKRLSEIYQSVPGAKGGLKEQRDALKIAKALFDVEKQKAEVARDKQKVDAKKRDLKAVDKAKNKSTSGGRRSANAQPNQRPKYLDSDTPESYSRKLQAFYTTSGG